VSEVRTVRKRDGREVAFDQGKIVDAIWRAAHSVGGNDRLLAEELGAVVAIFVSREFATRIPTIEEISDLIEKVLVETGHARTAKAFILERQRRSRIREALRVRDDEGQARQALATLDGAVASDSRSGVAVDGRGRAVVSEWSKARIVEALITEAELPATVAAEVAAEVERKVFASGATRISTTLVRALVDNELFERGQTRWIQRNAVLGMPRYDVDHQARSGGNAAALDAGVAAAVWRQHAFLEIHDSPVAEAHAAGVIDVGALAAPTRFQELDVEIGALAGVPPLRDERALLELRVAVDSIADIAAERVVLRGVLDALPLRDSDSRRDEAQLAASLLLALSRPAGAPRQPQIALELPLEDSRGSAAAASRYARFLLSAFEASAKLAARGLTAPALFVDMAGAEHADESLLEQLALAEGAADGGAAPRVIPCVVSAFAKATAAADPLLMRVAVNVAQAGLRAPRGDVAAAAQYVDDAVTLAAIACESRLRWLSQLAGTASPRDRAAQRLGDRARIGGGRFEIALAGLDAAARALTGCALLGGERGRDAGLVLLGAARKALSREAARRRQPLELALCEDEAALSRLGRVDFVRHPRGRERGALPHDGERYRYAASLPRDLAAASDGSPDDAAAIEAEIRVATARGGLGHAFATTRERAQFLRRVAPLLREDLLPCS
jgi:hypothetical protein